MRLKNSCFQGSFPPLALPNQTDHAMNNFVTNGLVNFGTENQNQHKICLA
jgi:hypothetical protein